MRQHQLMWEPVLPLGGRPILTRVNSAYMLKKVVVDRVDAEDGPYDVLHLGTGEEDEGKEKRGGKKMKVSRSVEENRLRVQLGLTSHQFVTSERSVELIQSAMESV